MRDLMALRSTQPNAGWEFLTSVVSQNRNNFYDEERQSAGLFAISNAMLRQHPSSETWFEDLPAQDQPYSDFRFDRFKALSYFEGLVQEIDYPLMPIVSPYFKAVAAYTDVDAARQAIDTMLASEIKTATVQPVLLDFATRMLRLRSVKSDPYQVVLINLLRFTYIKSLLGSRYT